MKEGPATENADLQDQVDAQGDDSLWTRMARDAYTSSQDYFNTSLRKEFEDAIAHFHSRHAPGSKYLHPAYNKKSKSFRPKTRATIRNNEMAVAVALFSTQDVVHIAPVNDSDPEQVKACEVKNHVLNYRLGKPEMNWFMTAIGGAQDAMTVGAVVSRQSWNFEERRRRVTGRPVENEQGGYDIDGEGSLEVIKDHPSIDPIPLENIRLHPGADWRDPIASSPYVIELMPMTVERVRNRATQPDPANPDQMLYREVDDMVMRASIERDWDSVRRIREGNRVDKYDHDEIINDYNTVWVHRNIVRIDGYDYVYDTLGPDWMLSIEARPIERVYLTGERPYAYGVAVIEAHKLFPAGIPKLTFESQVYANDIANLRQDNLRLTLNKRYWVRRGAQVDIVSLRRNVSGGVTLMSDTERDVKESSTPDVTGSSYEEQDRLNADFDEVAGAFSPSSVNTNRNLNETVGGMDMMSNGANMMQEYMVRTVVETWVERALRQVMRLIEEYESDLELLMTVASKFDLRDPREVLRYLKMPTELRVNAGFGSTNPVKRIEKLGFGFGTLAKFFPDLVQQADQKEVTTEVMGALGFRDGSRFFPQLYSRDDEDPRLVQMMQENEQLRGLIQSGIAEAQAKAQAEGEVKERLERIKQETALLKEQFADNREGYKAAIQAKIDDINARLDVAKEERERMSLALEREALSHSIAKDNWEMRMQEQDLDKGEEGAKDLKGEDKAGIYSRQQYGALPGSSQ